MLNIEEGAKLINNNETAVQVNAHSMLNMNDGEISGNAASTWGGGKMCIRDRYRGGYCDRFHL